MSQNDVNKQYDFALDLDKGYQGDGSISLIQSSSNVRHFTISLTKENSTFDLTNCLVKAVYFKADDNIVVNDVVILDANGLIDVKLTEQCMSEEGNVRCEIVAIDLVDPRFISFPVFKFKVKGSLFVNSGIESQSEFQTLLNAIAKVDVINDIADEKFAKIDQQYIIATQILSDLNVAFNDGLAVLNNIRLQHEQSTIDVEEIRVNKINAVSLHSDIEDMYDDVVGYLDESRVYTHEINESLVVANSNTNTIKANKTETDNLVAVVRTNKTTTDSLLGRIQSNDSEATKSFNNVKTQEANINNMYKTVTGSYNNMQNIHQTITNLGEEISLHGDIVKQEAVEIHDVYAEAVSELNEIKQELGYVQTTFESNETVRSQTFEQAEVNRNSNEVQRIVDENIRIENENNRDERYKTAEDNRDSMYDDAELNRGNEYKNAESARNTTFNNSETNRTTTFLTAQTQRTTTFNTSQTNRDKEYQTWKNTVMDANNVANLQNQINTLKTNSIAFEMLE